MSNQINYYTYDDFYKEDLKRENKVGLTENPEDLDPKIYNKLRSVTYEKAASKFSDDEDVTLPYQTWIQNFNLKDEFNNADTYKKKNEKELLEQFGVEDIRQIDDVKVAKAAYDKIREMHGEKSESNFISFSSTFSPKFRKRNVSDSVTDVTKKIITNIPFLGTEEQDKEIKYFVPRGFTKSEIAESLGYDQRQNKEAAFTRMVSSDAPDELETIRIARNVLVQQFTQKLGHSNFKLDVRTDPYTNLEMFTNPETGKREFLDSPKFDLSDIKEFNAMGRRIAADIIGYVGTGKLTKLAKLGKVKSSFIKATGTGVAVNFEDARIMAEVDAIYGGDREEILKRTDKEQKRIYAKKFKQYMDDGIIPYVDLPTAALTVAADAIYPVYRFFKYIASTGAAPLEVRNAFLKVLKKENPEVQAEDVVQIIKDARDVTSNEALKKQLNLNLAEGSDDAILLSIYKGLATSGKGGRDLKTINLFENISEERAKAIKDVLIDYADTFSNYGFDQIAFGQSIKELFRSRQNEEVKFLTNKLEKNTTNLINQKIITPAGNVKKQGEEISTIISDLRRAKEGRQSDRYTDLFVASGMNGKTFDMSAYDDLVKELYKDALGDAGMDVGLVQKNFNLPPMRKTKDLEDTVEVWHKTLKGVRVKLRDSTLSKKAKAYQTQIEKELNEMLQDQFGGTTFSREYGRLSDDVLEFYKKFDSNIVKDFRYEGDRLLVNGEDVIKQILKNENGSGKNVVADLKAFNDFVREIPGLKAKVKNLIVQDFADKTGATELKAKIKKFGFESLSPSDFKNFSKQFGKYIDDHPTAAELFLNVKNPLDKKITIQQKINSFLQVGKQIDSTVSKLKKEFNLNDDFRPEDLYRKAFDSRNPSETAKLMKLIKNETQGGGLVEAFREVVLKNFKESIFDNKNRFNELLFLKWYGNNKASFDIVFPRKGPLATEATKKINDAYKKLYDFTKYTVTDANTRAVRVGTFDLPPDIEGFVRYRLARPLSEEGVLLTKLIRKVDRVINDKFATVLLEPDLVKQFVKFKLLNKTTPAGYEAASKIFQELFGVSIRELERQTLDENLGNETYKPSGVGGDTPIGLPGRSNIQDTTPSENLSQAPIQINPMNMNQAPANMPPAQTNNVASAPVDNPQGIAALSPGQGSGTTAPGSGTNTQTIDRMDQLGLKFLA